MSSIWNIKSDLALKYEANSEFCLYWNSAYPTQLLWTFLKKRRATSKTAHPLAKLLLHPLPLQSSCLSTTTTSFKLTYIKGKAKLDKFSVGLEVNSFYDSRSYKKSFKRSCSFHCFHIWSFLTSLFLHNNLFYWCRGASNLFLNC